MCACFFVGVCVALCVMRVSLFVRVACVLFCLFAFECVAIVVYVLFM